MAERRGERPETVALGTIANVHGIRGEVRMLPYNPDTGAVHQGMELTLRRGDNCRTVTVSAIRPHKKFFLLTLAGVESRNDAERLVGWDVEIPASLLPAAGEGEIYHFDLIGLLVLTTGGEEIGVVEEVFCTAANDVCVVRRDGREVLVPYVDEVIREVDLEAGRLVIEPLPGLLD